MNSLQEKYLGRGKGWEYRYAVRGTWPFPTDMLRYDACRAATDLDQAIIDRLSGESAPEDMTLEEFRRPVLIMLIGNTRPTEGRWRSFMWRLV